MPGLSEPYHISESSPAWDGILGELVVSSPAIAVRTLGPSENLLPRDRPVTASAVNMLLLTRDRDLQRGRVSRCSQRAHPRDVDLNLPFCRPN
jgi:hypothetical protein